MCTMAGPPTSAIFPPLSLIRFISWAVLLIIDLKGFSVDASLDMNSKTPSLPLGRSGGTTRIPSLPTTILSPSFIWANGLQYALNFLVSNTMAQSISIFSTRIHWLPYRI